MELRDVMRCLVRVQKPLGLVSTLFSICQQDVCVILKGLVLSDKFDLMLSNLTITDFTILGSPLFSDQCQNNKNS